MNAITFNCGLKVASMIPEAQLRNGSSHSLICTGFSLERDKNKGPGPTADLNHWEVTTFEPGAFNTQLPVTSPMDYPSGFSVSLELSTKPQHGILQAFQGSFYSEKVQSLLSCISHWTLSLAWGRYLEGTCWWSKLVAHQLSSEIDKDYGGTLSRAWWLSGLISLSSLNSKGRQPIITISSFSISLQAAID